MANMLFTQTQSIESNSSGCQVTGYPQQYFDSFPQLLYAFEFITIKNLAHKSNPLKN